jgi:hypothetical protein
MARKKQQHFLEPLKRRDYPTAFVFLDTESRVPKPPTKDIFEEEDHKIRLTHKLRMAVAERWEWNETTQQYDRLYGCPNDTEAHPHGLRSEGVTVCPQCDSPISNGPDGVFLESKLHTPRAIAEALWSYVERFATADRSHVYVMGHNIGYDLLASAAYPIFAERGWKSEAVYAKGPIFIQRLEKNHRRVTFLSSTNYYALKLEKLAKSFGMEKLDGDWNGPEDPLLVYCRQDVAICRTAVLWLVNKLRELDIPWADTISSIAFKALRTKFLHHPVEVHTDARAVQLERRSYAGGRAEPFFIGKLPPLTDGERRFKLDKTSLYPSVMIDQPMPTRLKCVYSEGDITPAQLTEVVKRGDAVIADVTVDVSLPCIPLKWSRLLFITGRQETVLCTPELQLLLHHGGKILEVRGVAMYEQAVIFHDFVTFFWNMREEASRQECPQCKNVYDQYTKACPQCGVKTHIVNEAVKQLGKNIMNNCLDENTQLMDGRRIKQLCVGDVLEGQRVSRVAKEEKNAFEISLESGHAVIATAEHLFPTYDHQNTHMKLRPVFGTRMVPGLKAGTFHASSLRVEDWPLPSLPEEAVMAGIIWAEGPSYACGMPRGGKGPYATYPRWRMTLSTNVEERELNTFIRAFFTAHNIKFTERTRPFTSVHLFEIYGRRNIKYLDRIYKRTVRFPTKVVAAGFLRGAFEGDGSAHGRTIRLVQNSAPQRAIAERALKKLKLKYRSIHRYRHNVVFQTNGWFYPRTEEYTLQIDNDVTSFMRMVGFLSKIKRQRVLSRVTRIRPVGPRRVVDISLEGGDHLFWADGTRSHNCYGKNLGRNPKSGLGWATAHLIGRKLNTSPKSIRRPGRTSTFNSNTMREVYIGVTDLRPKATIASPPSQVS